MSLKVKIDWFKFKFKKEWKMIELLGFSNDWNYGALFYLSIDEELFDWDFIFIKALARWIRKKI